MAADTEVVRGVNRTLEPLGEEELPAPERRPSEAYLGSLSESSRRVMGGALDRLAGLLTGGLAEAELIPWWTLEPAQANEVRRVLREQYQPATANRYLTALRQTLRQSWVLGHLGRENLERLNVALEAVEDHADNRNGRKLSDGELRALKRLCLEEDGPIGVRDVALIAVMARAGLRRQEVADLDREDFRPNPEAEEARAAEIVVRSGKGEKPRSVPVYNGVTAVLERWIEVRGDHSGALFHPVRKGGTIEERRMTPQSIYERIKYRGEQLADREEGVRPFTPHDLRRTAGSDLLEAGVDVNTVADLLGHESTQTTRSGYDRRGEKRKRTAMAKLTF